MGFGFAGIDNELLYDPQDDLLFGDAKDHPPEAGGRGGGRLIEATRAPAPGSRPGPDTGLADVGGPRNARWHREKARPWCVALRMVLAEKLAHLVRRSVRGWGRGSGA